MSVNLTSGASVRPEYSITYSTDNEGQKVCGVFSEDAPLQRSSTPFTLYAACVAFRELPLGGLSTMALTHGAEGSAL